MDEIRFTDHCLLQMKERGISEKAVKACLRNPDKLIVQKDARVRAIKKISKLKKVYLCLVVFEQTRNLKEVVTVFYTSKIHKYL